MGTKLCTFIRFKIVLINWPLLIKLNVIYAYEIRVFPEMKIWMARIQLAWNRFLN